LTKEQLTEELKYVNHSIDKRNHYSRLFMEHPENIPLLLEIAFEVDQKISYRAAWVLEFMCCADLEHLLPHLELFSAEVHRVKFDSAKRPMAKICEALATAYYKNPQHPVRSRLKPGHRERLIETCFDWMISDEKVAVKAYAMNALYLFGTEYDWIHPELRMILEKDFATQSPAFKARARHILKRLKARGAV